MTGRKIKIVLDTNILVRIFVADIKKQTRECLRLLKFLKEEKSKFRVYIPQIVALELAWVLGGKYYGFSRQKISLILTSLMTENFQIAHKIDLKKGLNIFKKYNVKFGDAIIASADVVWKEGAIIVSYDKDFDKIREVVKMTPGEVLDNIRKKI